MSSVYYNVKHIKNEDNKELSAHIIISDQASAEADLNGIVLNANGSGYVEDRDNSKVVKNEKEMEKLCKDLSLPYKELLKNLKQKNGKKNTMENTNISEEFSRVLNRLKNATNPIEGSILTPERQQVLENVLSGKPLPEGMKLESLLKSVTERLEDTHSRRLQTPSEKMAEIIEETKPEQPSVKSKRTRRNKNGL